MILADKRERIGGVSLLQILNQFQRNAITGNLILSSSIMIAIPINMSTDQVGTDFKTIRQVDTIPREKETVESGWPYLPGRAVHGSVSENFKIDGGVFRQKSNSTQGGLRG